MLLKHRHNQGEGHPYSCLYIDIDIRWMLHHVSAPWGMVLSIEQVCICTAQQVGYMFLMTVKSYQGTSLSTGYQNLHLYFMSYFVVNRTDTWKSKKFETIHCLKREKSSILAKYYCYKSTYHRVYYIISCNYLKVKLSFRKTLLQSRFSPLKVSCTGILN